MFRIQSLWLFLAAFCAFLTYKLPFFNGNIIRDNISVPEKLTASFNALTLILTGFLLVGCLVLIFLYNNRRMQWWLTIAAIVISILDIIIYIGQKGKFLAGTGAYSLSAIFYLAIPVFLYLAAKSIRHDENLIKKVEKLR